MKIKISELRKLVRGGVRRIKEDFKTSNGEIDLDDPQTMSSNTFDLGDQETSTKIANLRIKFGLPDPGDENSPSINKRLDTPPIKKNDSWQTSLRKAKSDDGNPWTMAYFLRRQKDAPKQQES